MNAFSPRSQDVMQPTPNAEVVPRTGDEPTTSPDAASGRADRARALTWWLALWSLAYACFRGYYAVGGRFAMIGEPVSESEFNTVNAVGAVVIVLFAVILPLVMVRVGPLRQLLPVVGWVGAVGCCMHALVDLTLRVFSVTGAHPTQLPSSFWQSFDRRTADLQDMLFNEPWFFVDGLLWAAVALALVPRTRARRWVTSAVLACAALTVYGVLRGLDVFGPTVLG